MSFHREQRIRNFISMRWIILLVSLLTVCQNADSQSNSWSAGTLDIHIVPLALIDGNPRLRLGMEYHPRKRIGYSLDVGFGNNQILKYRVFGPHWGNDYSFFEIRPEIKWYKSKSSEYEVYYSAELFYLRMTDHLSNGFFYPEESSTTLSFDEASFTKQKIGLNFKTGIKLLVWKKMILDFYGGIGIAVRDINYADFVNLMYFDSGQIEYGPIPQELEGNYFVAQFPFGFKIGYLIKKW